VTEIFKLRPDGLNTLMEFGIVLKNNNNSVKYVSYIQQCNEFSFNIYVLGYFTYLQFLAHFQDPQACHLHCWICWSWEISWFQTVYTLSIK